MCARTRMLVFPQYVSPLVLQALLKVKENEFLYKDETILQKVLQMLSYMVRCWMKEVLHMMCLVLGHLSLPVCSGFSTVTSLGGKP